MENNSNYSDNWQPYINDYDKFEYDVKLNDGTIVENCYPNGGKFNSIYNYDCKVWGSVHQILQFATHHPDLA
jgi:hypothetical protein